MTGISLTSEDIERIEKLMNSVSALLDKYLVDGVRKEKLGDMFTELGQRIFTCPASAKTAYHSAYPGGSMIHSIAVTKNMMKLNATLGAEIPEDSIVFVGLVHDLGKIGNLDGTPYYVDNDSDWHIKNRGELYKHNPDLKDGLSHAQRSIRILTSYGIAMNDDEYLAILGHDGLYVPENTGRYMKNNESNLARIAHMADSWTVFGERL